MKNEKGITLIELLVAVVIAGIVIVPLLTDYDRKFYTNSKSRKETEVAYVAQEVMEIVDKIPSIYQSHQMIIQEYTVILIITKNTQIKAVMNY